MSTLEQLEQLIESAKRLGYQVRYEYFGGSGGGLCQVHGAKWLFLDLALNAQDQLEHLQQALADEPSLSSVQSAPVPRVA